MIFSEVMPAVRDGRADFGLVIHEGRFTYREHGLQILLDLGEWWEKETGFPIPLGGIAFGVNLGGGYSQGCGSALFAPPSILPGVVQKRLWTM